MLLQCNDFRIVYTAFAFKFTFTFAFIKCPYLDWLTDYTRQKHAQQNLSNKEWKKEDYTEKHFEEKLVSAVEVTVAQSTDKLRFGKILEQKRC